MKEKYNIWIQFKFILGNTNTKYPLKKFLIITWFHPLLVNISFHSSPKNISVNAVWGTGSKISFKWFYCNCCLYLSWDSISCFICFPNFLLLNRKICSDLLKMHGNWLHQMDSFAGYNPSIRERIWKAKYFSNDFCICSAFLSLKILQIVR